jgi:hypothetical protein
MKVGYARVSTREQSFDLQIDALQKAGCEKVYRDLVSGARAERPVLERMLAGGSVRLPAGCPRGGEREVSNYSLCIKQRLGASSLADLFSFRPPLFAVPAGTSAVPRHGPFQARGPSCRALAPRPLRVSPPRAYQGGRRPLVPPPRSRPWDRRREDNR